ncbi:extracellular solute-binding protein [Streptomyces sp. SUK 48]|uniref:ABC transporter substrate-binding protein n=1 Tax=Streptomyces sp. SUK 48 TaxID=2582831 RepID=UPI00129A4653|nr:extracellular solute-binding protein [Streptomyces sp. SUK 48]
MSGRPRGRARTVAVLASCLLLLAAAVVLGTRALGREPTVTLLANWTGPDEANLRRAVIEPFERTYHVHVDYQGSSAESQVLGADVEAGTPPDVVVLTGPGELAGYAGQQQLQPLDGLIPRADFGASWATPLADGHVYWFPLKADLKSIVWYPADTGERQRRAARDDPAQWCVGMGSGATSGWPGTDWIEDILLQQHGAPVYQSWASGKLSWRSPEVRRAWTTWGRLMGAGTSEKLLRRTLKTDYAEASAPVTAGPRGCTLEHQASFIRTRSTAWKRADGRYDPSADLIPGATAKDTWEVSGDLVALLHATPQARRLIRYLSSPAAQRAWADAESAFSVDTGARAAATGPAWHRSLADTLLSPAATHCFDASDAMPPTVRDAFAEATIDYLAHPARLTSLLSTLDTLRTAPGQTWLPSVCDQVS